MPKSYPQLHVIDHPRVADYLTQLRDEATPAPAFRNLLARVGELIAYEATRDLTTHDITVRTPLEEMSSSRLALPLTIVPILRAGLGMSEGVHRLLPEAKVGHLGMYRDEEKLLPVTYYQKLPDHVADGPVLLVDPMLATGGSAIASIRLLRDKGCTDVRLLCLIAAPEGVEAIIEAFDDVPIHTAALDRELNDVGFIMPGLGDAGDRQFGTD